MRESADAFLCSCAQYVIDTLSAALVATSCTSTGDVIRWDVPEIKREKE